MLIVIYYFLLYVVVKVIVRLYLRFDLCLFFLLFFFLLFSLIVWLIFFLFFVHAPSIATWFRISSSFKFTFFQLTHELQEQWRRWLWRRRLHACSWAKFFFRGVFLVLECNFREVYGESVLHSVVLQVFANKLGNQSTFITVVDLLSYGVLPLKASLLLGGVICMFFNSFENLGSQLGS